MEVRKQWTHLGPSILLGKDSTTHLRLQPSLRRQRHVQRQLRVLTRQLFHRTHRYIAYSLNSPSDLNHHSSGSFASGDYTVLKDDEVVKRSTTNNPTSASTESTEPTSSAMSSASRGRLVGAIASGILFPPPTYLHFEDRARRRHAYSSISPNDPNFNIAGANREADWWCLRSSSRGAPNRTKRA